MPDRVEWSKQVAKQLDRVPPHIRDKFFAWVLVVERVGLFEARRLPGYHDEPLKGRRAGQRSIRLNRAYRAIYEQSPLSNEICVIVIKVSKHEY